MKKLMILAVMGLAGYGFGQDTEDFTITRVQTVVRTQIEFEDEFLETFEQKMGTIWSFDGSGYEMAYVVEGGNPEVDIVGMDMVITRVYMKDGTDISKVKSFRSVINADGKCAQFTVYIKTDKANAEEVPMIEGNVTVRTAEEKEMKTVKFFQGDTESQTIGKYTLTPSYSGFKINSHRNFLIKVKSETGSAGDIGGMEIIAGGIKTRSTVKSVIDSAGVTEFGFSEAPTSDFTVNLTLWKNLKEQTVSF